MKAGDIFRYISDIQGILTLEAKVERFNFRPPFLIGGGQLKTSYKYDSKATGKSQIAKII